ncbi:uncharacterized protein LOC132796520 isoform X1 [Drosophila nasuta]|uniref:uncharacterized protein LOC132796520 isoform X1 n=2 Tax=Drosophila nasuta TaxID=42062 RepID=UPI00295F3EAD|nr:uncharacterized protein LOC132796520 isoform X1 [Drosophila nasuta]
MASFILHISLPRCSSGLSTSHVLPTWTRLPMLLALPLPLPPTPSCSPCRSPTATPLLMQRVKAKRHCPLGLGKENIELTSTSTPLPAASTRTPLLRDLSNIINMSPLQTTTNTTTTTTPQVQRCRSQLQLKPTTVYASTLPTFEAEYSPSYRTNQENQSNNIIPGPLLALRGIGIPDSYFEKPRYLEQKSIPQPLPSVSTEAGDAPSVEPTLSSTQMGDVTLERMIDAILESTRKPPTGLGAAAGRPRCRQRLRHRHQHQHQQRLLSTGVVHSPTYRPAFDPASDLREYWQSSPPARSSINPDGYEEREVCSPQPQPQTQSGLGVKQGRRSLQLQLRRQRVVRRKRKITTKISSSVRQSAQKLLAAASRSAQKKLPHATSTSSTCSSRSKQRHISPDSGHNSTSDCEFEAEQELDSFGVVTKRRLSFSFHEDAFVEK